MPWRSDWSRDHFPLVVFLASTVLFVSLLFAAGSDVAPPILLCFVPVIWALGTISVVLDLKERALILFSYFLLCVIGAVMIAMYSNPEFVREHGGPGYVGRGGLAINVLSAPPLLALYVIARVHDDWHKELAICFLSGFLYFTMAGDPFQLLSSIPLDLKFYTGSGYVVLVYSVAIALRLLTALTCWTFFRSALLESGTLVSLSGKAMIAWAAGHGAYVLWVSRNSETWLLSVVLLCFEMAIALIVASPWYVKAFHEPGPDTILKTIKWLLPWNRKS